MSPSQAVIDELVRRVVEAVHPVRIILFGSAARGDMKEYSDLDILVVLPDGAQLSEEAGNIYGNMRGFGHGVDVVPATEELLQKYGNNFSLVYYPALREGKEIYAF